MGVSYSPKGLTTRRPLQPTSELAQIRIDHDTSILVYRIRNPSVVSLFRTPLLNEIWTPRFWVIHLLSTVPVLLFLNMEASLGYLPKIRGARQNLPHETRLLFATLTIHITLWLFMSQSLCALLDCLIINAADNIPDGDPGRTRL